MQQGVASGTRIGHALLHVVPVVRSQLTKTWLQRTKVEPD
jgi:hypothetical protein